MKSRLFSTLAFGTMTAVLVCASASALVQNGPSTGPIYGPDPAGQSGNLTTELLAQRPSTDGTARAIPLSSKPALTLSTIRRKLRRKNGSLAKVTQNSSYSSSIERLLRGTRNNDGLLNTKPKSAKSNSLSFGGSSCNFGNGGKFCKAN